MPLAFSFLVREFRQIFSLHWPEISFNCPECSYKERAQHSFVVLDETPDNDTYCSCAILALLLRCSCQKVEKCELVLKAVIAFGRKITRSIYVVVE